MEKKKRLSSNRRFGGMEPWEVEQSLIYLRRKLSSVTQRRNGKWIVRQEARLAARVKRRFNRQRDWLVEHLSELPFFQEDQKSNKRRSTKAYPDDINIFVSKLPEVESMVDDIVEFAGYGWTRGARLAYKDLNMADAGVSFDLVNESALAYLQALKDIQLSDYRGSISRTTRRKIIEILTDAAESGASAQKTAEEIMKQGKEGIFTRSRAQMIATNEIGRAYGEGNRQMVERFIAETGAIMEKAWLTVGDDRVTLQCQENEAVGWIGFNETFPSSDLAAPRHDHPRCRCDTIHREIDIDGNPI